MALRDGQEQVTWSRAQRRAPLGAAAPPCGAWERSRLYVGSQNRLRRAGWRALPQTRVWCVLGQGEAFQIPQAIQRDDFLVSEGERKESSEVVRGCHQATAEPGEATPPPSRAVHSGCSSSKWSWGSRNAGSSQTGPGYQWRCGRVMVKHGLILLYDVVQGGGDVHVAGHCMSCIIYIFN